MRNTVNAKRKANDFFLVIYWLLSNRLFRFEAKSKKLQKKKSDGVEAEI